MNYLIVGAGGILGAMSRYGVYQLVSRYLPSGFPYATLIVNVVGSFLLGLLVAHTSNMPEKLMLLAGVGFMGAFTTFSTFSIDLITLYKAGHHLLCVVNLIANPLFAVLAALIGMKVFN